jgi:hypothetical protein
VHAAGKRPLCAPAQLSCLLLPCQQAGPSAPPPSIPGAPAPQRAPPASASPPEELAARPLELAYTPVRAVRPSFGRGGRTIRVKANWFKASERLGGCRAGGPAGWLTLSGGGPHLHVWPCSPRGGVSPPIKHTHTRTHAQLHTQVDCSLTEAYHYDVEVRGARRPDAPEQPPEPRGPAAQRPLPAEICRWGGGCRGKGVKGVPEATH